MSTNSGAPRVISCSPLSCASTSASELASVETGVRTDETWASPWSALRLLEARSKSRPMPPVSAARARNVMVGKPGIRANATINAPPTSSALGCAPNCWPMSLARFSVSSVLTRVTMIPAVIAISSAGICATSPSPMVRIEYTCMASSSARPRCVIPMTSPPTRLTAMMMSPAIASPFTNFIAPSMEP